MLYVSLESKLYADRMQTRIIKKDPLAGVIINKLLLSPKWSVSKIFYLYYFELIIINIVNLGRFKEYFYYIKLPLVLLITNYG